MKPLIYGVTFLAFFLIFAGADVGVVFSLFMLAATFFFIRKTIHTKKTGQTIKEIDAMSGEAFEHYCAKLLRSQGYKADVTQSSGDYGADIVATKMVKGKIQKTVVQCKRYQSNVGISAVQEIVASKAHYKAHKTMVITNSYFTDAAKKLALSNKTQLIDRNDLQKQISQTGSETGE